MFHRTRAAFNTGAFEHDFRAWIVAGFAAIIGLAATALLIDDLRNGQYLIACVILVCPLMMVVVGWQLIYRQNLSLASYLLVSSGFVAVALTLTLSGGRATGPYVFLPVILLVALIVTNRRFSLAVAIACVVSILVGAWLTTTPGDFPAKVDTDRMLWGAIRLSIVSCLLVFGCMTLFRKASDRTRARLIEAQERAEQANDDLTSAIESQKATMHLLAKLQEIGKLRGWWYEPSSKRVHHTFDTAVTMGEFTLDASNRLETPDSPIRGDIRDLISDLMEPGEAWDKEIRINSESGNEVWCRAIGEIEYDEKNVSRVIGVLQDITQIKESQARNTQSQKMEAIGTLASGIAHEINTPIQYVSDNVSFIGESYRDIHDSLKAISEMVLQYSGNDVGVLKQNVQNTLQEADLEFLFEEMPRSLTETTEGLERIKTIVAAMKVFAHPGNDERTKIDLNDAIRSTLVVCANRWKYAADMVTGYDDQLPAVECMPDEFNQVILNIVVNAADALQESIDAGVIQKGEIRIATQSHADFVEIRISDNGGGIPEDIRGRVFDPFFTTKDVGKGTGQGLAISYDVIVNRHGGTLVCESKPGVGTTFRIGLPVVAEATPDEAEVA